MHCFNPLRHVSHKVILVLLYLQFFVVQWALRYTFPPEQNWPKTSVSVSDRHSESSLSEQKDDGKTSHLRLNKRYFPVLGFEEFPSVIPTPVSFEADLGKSNCISLIFPMPMAQGIGQRGPPVS